VGDDALAGDRAWAAAFKRGERDALERVFFSYADGVARQIRATRLREHDVEAVVHEVFLKAFSESARLSWDGLRPFGAWLNTMTRNLLIDRARKERRLQFRDPDDMPTVIDDGPDPSSHLDALELRDVLTSFRTTLSAEDASLFHTRFERQQSIAQTAALLQWSEIRVRKSDTALRARLLHALRAAGFFRDTKIKIGTSLLSRKQREGS
jgi:RNA polymerase sigma-70 factor, ECF subfamily